LISYNILERNLILSSLTKGLILLLVIVGVVPGSYFGRTRFGGHSSVSYNSVSKTEMGNSACRRRKKQPDGAESLAEDPEMKKQQLDSLKQLLAFASEAQREGLTN
jgi:hypothetical protein